MGELNPIPFFFNSRNMIRLNDIQAALSKVVGWEQNYDPQNQIDKALCESERGLTYQGAHPLLTIDNMAAIIPDDASYIYPPYNEIKRYAVGEKILYEDEVWIANRPTQGVPPKVTDFNKDFNKDFGSWLAGNWVRYNLMSDFIRKQTNDSIKKVVTRFIRDKVIGMETRNIIEKRTLFDGAGRIADTIENKGNVVGFEIVPLREGGITMKIEQLGLQFYGNTGDIKLYLFHSSCAEPVWTKTITYNRQNGTYQWEPVQDLYLPYLNPLTNAGGSWYLVYWQKVLPKYAEAVNFARDWSREPCSTCNKGDVMLYREMTKYVRISPFRVEVGNDWDGTLWNIADNLYTNTLNYGINVQFSIGCDLTGFIIDQRMIFAEVIQKQVASDCLRAIALNPNVRVNRNQANVGRDNILYELDGNGQGVKGLNGDLEKAYKALSIDTTGLDKTCLGCHTGGVRIRAI